MVAALVARYETPEFINRISDIGAIAIALSAIVGIILLVGKAAVWLDKRKDDRFAQRVREIMEPIIKEATYNIQTRTNGGYSLSDLHERLDAIETHMGIPVNPRPTVAIDMHPDLD
jgi:hypothetical protein